MSKLGPAKLRSRMPFGKYKGHTVEDIITTDVGYVTWAIEQELFELDEITQCYYDQVVDKKKEDAAFNDFDKNFNDFDLYDWL